MTGDIMNNGLPVSIVIFGASGDLTQRKLVPSLFNLYRKGRMPKQFRIVGFGGTAFSDDQFRAHLTEGMKQFASFEFKDEDWDTFASNLVYLQGHYTDLDDFKKLAAFLKSMGDQLRQSNLLHGNTARCFPKYY